MGLRGRALGWLLAGRGLQGLLLGGALWLQTWESEASILLAALAGLAYVVRSGLALGLVLPAKADDRDALFLDGSRLNAARLWRFHRAGYAEAFTVGGVGLKGGVWLALVAVIVEAAVFLIALASLQAHRIESDLYERRGQAVLARLASTATRQNAPQRAAAHLLLGDADAAAQALLPFVGEDHALRRMYAGIRLGQGDLEPARQLAAEPRPAAFYAGIQVDLVLARLAIAEGRAAEVVQRSAEWRAIADRSPGDHHDAIALVLAAAHRRAGDEAGASGWLGSLRRPLEFHRHLAEVSPAEWADLVAVGQTPIAARSPAGLTNPFQAPEVPVQAALGSRALTGAEPTPLLSLGPRRSGVRGWVVVAALMVLAAAGALLVVLAATLEGWS